MSDLVKGVLGGAWSLVVGWLLPTFVVLQVAAAVSWVLPWAWVGTFAAQPAGQRQVTLLFAAVVIGIVLAGLKTPLYRVLEGYLWPSGVRRARIRAHQEIRAGIAAAVDADVTAPTLRNRWTSRWRRWWGLAPRPAHPAARTPLEKAIALSRLRYPAHDDHVMPTALGNAIRRFETYGTDRWNLDTIGLFHHLAAFAPASVREAQERARTSVDLAVAFLYGSALLGLGAALAWALVVAEPMLLLTTAGSWTAAVAAYWVAVVATDEWAATVRAQVDLGRVGLAQALGLQLPEDVSDERTMWTYVNGFITFSREDEGHVPGWITHFRRVPPDPSAAADLRLAAAIDRLAVATEALVARLPPGGGPGDPGASTAAPPTTDPASTPSTEGGAGDAQDGRT